MTSFDDLKQYLGLRSSEITGRTTELLGKKNKTQEVILELERLKSKSFEFDRIVRFRTNTEFMDESEYYIRLKKLFGF
ncbi:hypothetical protein LCGC14_1320050 [marine sediment metagenome]|uniref:Uncharacterized protein n=1 Tax=marine sediment metagenome TaxID=412755 RepID=A0A0F9L528_9ZZZZ|nr:hypothetical protein [Candidatus Aminicenantes bacterium]